MVTMLEQVALSSFSGFTRVATTLMARGRARRVAKEDCTNNTGQLPSPIENRRLCRKRGGRGGRLGHSL